MNELKDNSAFLLGTFTDKISRKLNDTKEGCDDCIDEKELSALQNGIWLAEFNSKSFSDGKSLKSPVVFAGMDSIFLVGETANFIATLQPGTFPVSKILWEQLSGEQAFLTGSDTLKLAVDSFTEDSEFKVTVTDTFGLKSSDTVKLIVGGVIFYGFLNSLPVTESDVKSLPQQAPLNSQSISLNTGLNSIFCFAVLPGSVVESITDTSNGGENIKSQYIKQSISIDDILFDVYVMQNMLPYSTNHIHEITFI